MILLQETYPSTPPVWFAESEETSITNAVQVLSNTEGRDNHVIQQVAILLRELCRLHSVPEPPDIDRLTLPTSGTPSSITSSHPHQQQTYTHRLSSDVEHMDTDSGTGDVDPASADDDEEDEDEDSDGDGEDVEEDLQLDMEEVAPRTKQDEMGVEHLATLERLRQNQRRDYLKVNFIQTYCTLQ